MDVEVDRGFANFFARADDLEHKHTLLTAKVYLDFVGDEVRLLVVDHLAGEETLDVDLVEVVTQLRSGLDSYDVISTMLQLQVNNIPNSST